ncbi:MAG: anaerobic ribonucleoside-triphosphate reductase activating protein [Bacillota bacterium]|nr:anaerobic ribonucleoside-triphosphate reductase activating protein [Bacillota bacterium]
MMQISGLVRTSTVDYPGLLSAVIFTPGCNFDCFYCHNRLLIGRDAPLMDLETVMAFLCKRRGMVEGIVISGGEPLLQPDLSAFMQTVKGMGYHIKLDTNGSRPYLLQSIIRADLADKIAVDYKAPWTRYPEICGCRPADADAVRSSIDLLAQSTVAWEVRTTVPPQLSADDLIEMARTVRLLPAWYLQLYRRPEQFKQQDRFRIDAPGYTPSDLERLAETLRPRQPSVSVRL